MRGATVPPRLPQPYRAQIEAWAASPDSRALSSGDGVCALACPQKSDAIPKTTTNIIADRIFVLMREMLLP
jgi:hypothetical protein